MLFVMSVPYSILAAAIGPNRRAVSTPSSASILSCFSNVTLCLKIYFSPVILWCGHPQEGWFWWRVFYDDRGSMSTMWMFYMRLYDCRFGGFPCSYQVKCRNNSEGTKFCSQLAPIYTRDSSHTSSDPRFVYNIS